MRHRIRIIQPCKQLEPPNCNRLNLCSIQQLWWLSKGVHHQTRQTVGQVVGFLLQNPTLLDLTIIFLRCLNIHLDPPSPSQSPLKLAEILQSLTRSGGDLVISGTFFFFHFNPNRLNKPKSPHLKTNSIWSVFSPTDGGCCFLPPNRIRLSFGCVQTQLGPTCRHAYIGFPFKRV